jgi:hypothetical protein
MKLHKKNVGEGFIAVHEGEGPTLCSGQIYFQGKRLTCPWEEVWWTPASFWYGGKKINPFFCPRNIMLSVTYVIHYCYGQTAMIDQYSKTNLTHFSFNFLRIKASTCFEHYFLILTRRYTSGTWYIACVLCQLAATDLLWCTINKTLSLPW